MSTQAQTGGRGRAVLAVSAVIAVLVIGGAMLSGYYADWLWFSSVDATVVYVRQLLTQAGMFFAFALLMGLVIWGNLTIAYRVRPVLRGATPDQVAVERYRQAFDPVRRVVFIVAPLLLALLAGLSGSADWRAFLLFLNGVPFGQADAQFGLDVGFFVYDYPFYRLLTGFLVTVVVLSLISALAVHYLYGGIRLAPAGQRATRAAQTHLSLLLAVFALVKAAAYWLDRYGLALQQDALVAGLRFRDVSAVLPARSLLMWLAIVVAVLFLVNAFIRRWTIPLIGLASLFIVSIIAGGIYPALLQQFIVRPNEADREAPYIERNIISTREAYGLSKVEITDYPAVTEPDLTVLATQGPTLRSIRLMDPALLSPTFRQLQQVRGYYAFPDALDIDRYPREGQSGVDGRRGAVVAVRELNLAGLPAGQDNWINSHTVFTHGFGFVAAFDNTATVDGRPDFFEFDIPPRGDLDLDEPRIYFGEASPAYSIVGGPAGTEPRELDFPDDTSPNGQRNNTYTGSGGVPIGSLLNRLVYTFQFSQPNIILSNLVNSESRLLYIRQPRERIAQVAPWLVLDGDPYPVAANGRITWIVDAYTTTALYPYATRTTLIEATTDSLNTTTTSLALQPRRVVNYMRNSVKATVDAYDGTVRLYAWEPDEPLLRTWSRVFPGTVTPISEMPPDLLAHVRYPEDLFKVQRQVLSRYHVTDPLAFYSGQDFWIIPNDPTNPSVAQPQPPYYLQLQMPGDTETRFALTTTFSPQRRQTLASFMAADSDPGEGYGRLRVLQLPRNTVIPGPSQVQNNFESDPRVGELLNLLRRGGSDVELGNLLSLPVAGGLLYVEPVYVKAASGESYPLLRRVLAAFGQQVVFEETVEAALQALFGTAVPATPLAPDQPGADQPAPGPTPTPAPTPSAPTPGAPVAPTPGDPSPRPTVPPTPSTPALGDPDAALALALADMRAAVADAEAALRAGDFAAYGRAQDALAEALDRAIAAQERLRPGSLPGTAAPARF
ncbi:MAG: UPF0182 family protein [Actinomycetales bacterium]|nr:UPF0182 family protein [Actinomycetales bacterium]